MDLSKSPARIASSPLRRSSSCVRRVPLLIRPLTIAVLILHFVFLPVFEFDEILDFALRVRAERSQLVEHHLNAIVILKEFTDRNIKSLKDLQKGIQPNFILSLLHAGKVGLMDADFLGELYLRQL